MLRITEIAESAEYAVLRLEGRMIGTWVRELERSCERHLLDGRRLTLDVADVSFVDRAGLALLRSLMEGPVSLANVPLLLNEQLKDCAR